LHQRQSDLDESKTSSGGERKANANPLVLNILQVSPSLAIFCGDSWRSESTKPRRINNVAALVKKKCEAHPQPLPGPRTLSFDGDALKQTRALRQRAPPCPGVPRHRSLLRVQSWVRNEAALTAGIVTEILVPELLESMFNSPWNWRTRSRMPRTPTPRPRD